MDQGRSSQLGKYQLVAEIARGGMGIVYLAIATGPARFSKLLVVKELKPDLAEDPAFTEMFLEEARLAARLNHPNIVQTYEIGEDAGRHYMVMDYLEGITLARLLRKRSPILTRELQLRIICEVLQGLDYAHGLKNFDGTPLGMVHRDVSPQNVFLTYDGQAKLVDFGIAKAIDSAVETRTGMLKGKPSYMAPEQMRGTSDPRADIYSVGVVLWEAVAGRRMWHRKSDLEVLAALLNGSIPSIREAAPDAPEELIRIVTRALEREPSDRYASAAAMREDIEAYLKSVGDTSTIRDAAAIAADLFKTERETTRTTIETHLAGIEAGKERGRLPSIRPPFLEGPHTPSLGDRADLSDGSIRTASSTSTLQSSGSFRTAPSVQSQRTPPAMNEISIEVVSDSERRRTGMVTAAVLAGAVLIGGVAFFLGRGRTTAAGRADTNAATATEAVVAAPSALASASATVLSLSRPPTTSASAPEEMDSGPARTETPTTLAAKSDLPRGQSRYAIRPTHPTAHDRDPSPAEKAGDDDPSTSAPAAVSPSSGTGYLTLDTFPWTHVSLSGHPLGDTPLVHVPIPSGTHTLSLDNPDENVHKSTIVTLKTGESVSRRLAF